MRQESANSVSAERFINQSCDGHFCSRSVAGSRLSLNNPPTGSVGSHFSRVVVAFSQDDDAKGRIPNADNVIYRKQNGTADIISTASNDIGRLYIRMWLK